ncbi:hypothetical protein J6590_067386 [Homalodisca vitripennis]|nr:hypothetical protein J6590_067386 [Homalodisca vitripennis]
MYLQNFKLISHYEATQAWRINVGYFRTISINLYTLGVQFISIGDAKRLCSRTPASTVLYRTGHSVMNYSFAVVLCVSESVKDIFRLHACLQDSSLFPHLLITTWPSTTAVYG